MCRFLNNQLNLSVTRKETKWTGLPRLKSYGLDGLNDSISFLMMLKSQGMVSVRRVSALSSLLSVDSLSTPVSLCGLPLVWVDIFSSYQGTGHIGLETYLYDLILA